MSEPVSSNLNGKRAVVTGAGNGLGLSIAQRLLAGGARILVVDKDPAVLSRFTSSHSSNVFAIVKDLADDDAAAFIFSQVEVTLGVADILINNAAWSFHKRMLDVSISEFDRLVQINQRAPYFLAQAFMRQYSDQAKTSEDPNIVNIASVNALAGNANLIAYAGTKGAIVAMTRAMAVEMKNYGVRVNSVSPGAIETSETLRLIEEEVVDRASLLKNILTHRLGSCGEIAELVAYLCSPAANYVNGANWVIDGGYLA